MDAGDAGKVETLTGVIAVGGYLRDVVGDALRFMLGRAPTTEEVDQVLSGAF